MLKFLLFFIVSFPLSAQDCNFRYKVIREKDDSVTHSACFESHEKATAWIDENKDASHGHEALDIPLKRAQARKIDLHAAEQYIKEIETAEGTIQQDWVRIPKSHRVEVVDVSAQSQARKDKRLARRQSRQRLKQKLSDKSLTVADLEDIVRVLLGE